MSTFIRQTSTRMRQYKINDDDDDDNDKQNLQQSKISRHDTILPSKWRLDHFQQFSHSLPVCHGHIPRYARRL